MAVRHHGTVEVMMDCKLELNAASVHAGTLHSPHGNSCRADAACLVAKHNDLNRVCHHAVVHCCMWLSCTKVETTVVHSHASVTKVSAHLCVPTSNTATMLNQSWCSQ